MRKAPARRAAASSVPIVLIFMQVSTPSVFPSSQRSIQSCPAGQLHNSKEVGRTKTKDLSSYFLERGMLQPIQIRRRYGEKNVVQSMLCSIHYLDPVPHGPNVEYGFPARHRHGFFGASPARRPA